MSIQLQSTAFLNYKFIMIIRDFEAKIMVDIAFTLAAISRIIKL